MAWRIEYLDEPPKHSHPSVQIGSCDTLGSCDTISEQRSGPENRHAASSRVLGSTPTRRSQRRRPCVAGTKRRRSLTLVEVITLLDPTGCVDLLAIRFSRD